MRSMLASRIRRAPVGLATTVGGVFVAATLLAASALAAPPKRDAVPADTHAQMGGGGCDSTFVVAVEASRAVFVARPKAVATTTRGSTFVVDVTYTVDRALYGTKVAEVKVEETCQNIRVPYELMGTPAESGYCVPGRHVMPGLTSDGRVAGGDVVLLLRTIHPVDRDHATGTLSRETVTSFCPDVEPLYKRRPPLRELVKRVSDLRANGSVGFPAPPPLPEPPAPAPSASATPSPSAAASASATPSPSPSASAAPPVKRFGCGAAPAPSGWGGGATGGAGGAGLALALAVALAARRRQPFSWRRGRSERVASRR